MTLVHPKMAITRGELTKEITRSAALIEIAVKADERSWCHANGKDMRMTAPIWRIICEEALAGRVTNLRIHNANFSACGGKPLQTHLMALLNGGYLTHLSFTTDRSCPKIFPKQLCALVNAVIEAETTCRLASLTLAPSDTSETSDSLTRLAMSRRLTELTLEGFDDSLHPYEVYPIICAALSSSTLETINLPGTSILTSQEASKIAEKAAVNREPVHTLIINAAGGTSFRVTGQTMTMATKE
jgi:hypothetical protein